MERINDPNYVIQMALGPPVTELVAQHPGSGLIIGNRICQQEMRFVFKKAHMSRDDFRIYSADGRLTAVAHHFGKNPYGSLDPLGMSDDIQRYGNQYQGEWDSIMDVSGYCGMSTIKIRPKLPMSRHGRQIVSDPSKHHTYFNIAKESKLHSLMQGDLRSNMLVCKGEGKEEELYRIHPDMIGRTFQIVNTKDELVCLVQKPAKVMIQNAALGSGSEMQIDIARGVDWTAMLAVIISIQQVGQSLMGDAFDNYIVSPLQGMVVDEALAATGTEGMVDSVSNSAGSAIRAAEKARNLFNQFYK